MNIREHITTGALSRIRGTEGPRSVVPPSPKVEDLAGVAGATGHFEGRMHRWAAITSSLSHWKTPTSTDTPVPWPNM